jgi:flavin reductase (DIM6/NTAB) family NADH-FMN oxidoreductase RutF
MTIHGDHPFLPPETGRSPVRRLRGRFGGGVSVWTTGVGRGRAGLTVSSMLVGDGDPGRVLGLLDPESELANALADTETFVVNILGWSDRGLADAFAGVAPAPGGVFTLGSWTDAEWGPVLDSALAWAGCRLVAEEMRAFGWSLLVEAIIEKVELREESDEPLLHRRGRYQRPSG